MEFASSGCFDDDDDDDKSSSKYGVHLNKVDSPLIYGSQIINNNKYDLIDFGKDYSSHRNKSSLTQRRRIETDKLKGINCMKNDGENKHGANNNYEQACTVSTYIQSTNMINDFSSVGGLSSNLERNVN